MATSTKVLFWNTNLGLTIKAMGYIALSSAISYLITVSTGNPEMFGPITPIVNIALVFIKKTFLSNETPNIGAM